MSNGVSDHKSNLSDEAMLKATGKAPDDWFALLDAEKATLWTHTEIARWLVDVQGVDGWWAQSVTVRYEQERGMRLPGQQGDGTFSVSATKTVPHPVPAVLDATIRLVSAEFGHAPSSSKSEVKRPYARWKVDGEAVLASLEDKNGKTALNLTHSGIIDGSRVEHAKPTLARLLTDIAADLG
ncbi:hypothetical protein [Salinibacterium sp. ZJ454]|uniref:hypothetical protein n=1 Tax=Salinibacterium sp. ZJ454 TaxID=2708339 RepID=UPI00142230B3|nr:hypothetical protein [Salinibacterium sp. ZJ454]